MDTSQVTNLAIWVENHLPDISNKYRVVSQILDHNAKQAQKQPFREELEDLTNSLARMNFEHLTNEEVDLLKEMETLQYLGERGRKFVNGTFTTSEFDPATAASDLREGVESIDSTIQKFDIALDALSELGLEYLDDDQTNLEFPLVRVRFKDKASIEDIAKLKKWAADWHDIARGVAMSVGETPQSVRIVGANNGSIIVTLTTVASVTIVLAIIAKNSGRIAAEVLGIANDIEDFRHKRRLNKVIEDELKNQQTKVQETGVEDTLKEIKETFPDLIKGEVENALKKSITKYFDFYKKGGDVDFIPPRSQRDDDDIVEDQELIEQIAAQSEENQRLVGVIEEVRAQQAEILQLVNYKDKPDDNE